jgi:microcystin-dependent protein
MNGGIIGSVTLFAGNFAPKNFAFCQGQLMSISQYTALFSILGTNFGGNGTTNFAIPNLQGRAVLSAGQGPGLSEYTIGESAGQASTPLGYGEMPVHSHPVNANITPAAATNVTTSNPVQGVYASGTELLYNSSGDTNMLNYIGVLQTGKTGNGNIFPILHPVLGLNYIICLNGVFPQRS